jgi:hypothetical protein
MSMNDKNHTGNGLRWMEALAQEQIEHNAATPTVSASICSQQMRAAGNEPPRTCPTCKLGPCKLEQHSAAASAVPADVAEAMRQLRAFRNGESSFPSSMFDVVDRYLDQGLRALRSAQDAMRACGKRVIELNDENDALRKKLASVEAVELMGVREQIEEGSGFWRECSGCYETEDGHPVGQYGYSDAMRCALGSGCSECGGIGAVWDNTDYEALGHDWVAEERDVEVSPAAQEDLSQIEFVTRQSAIEAIDHLDRSNHPGRRAEAIGFLAAATLDNAPSAKS